MGKQRLALLSYRVLVTLILGYIGVAGVIGFAAGNYASNNNVMSVFGIGCLFVSILYISMAVLHFRQPIYRLITVASVALTIFFLLPLSFLFFHGLYNGSLSLFLPVILGSSFFLIPLAMVYFSCKLHTKIT